jgi:membrane protein implicated in regulation of membrane protease activity
MSDRTPTRPSAPGPGRLIAAGAVLAVAIVVPLLVWTYARTSPELAGIPFFFWYQFLLVVVAVALTAVAHRLVLSHDRDRRAAQGLDRDGGAA